jgi:hypothetical protein
MKRDLATLSQTHVSGDAGGDGKRADDPVHVAEPAR